MTGQSESQSQGQSHKMNPSPYTEDTLVQQTTAEYLEQQLGWESVYAHNSEDFGPDSLLGRTSDSEVVLTRYLLTALRTLNPDLPEDAYNDAVRKITSTTASQSIVATNREKYNFIRNGVPVTFRNANGEQTRERLQIFDFDTPENNHFLCVRELYIKGDLYRRRADIIGFVNGLPLLFIECKNIYRDLKAAYRDNYSDYRDTVPHIFHHNAIVMFGNGEKAKLGVFWHTQGAGKSYAMVLFTRKVHRKLGGNFTFLILTDRTDLDTQIYKTFAGCGVVDDQTHCRAADGPHLNQLLTEHKSHIFSLIQKFNQDIDTDKGYTQRDDIIVITDEAHRTQYGKLANNLRAALPNASYIGFTGTPLFKDDQITRRVFGDYVSTYDFQRAVEDNATLPLYYDARGDKLGIAIDDLNERIAEKLEESEISDIDEEQHLERELKRAYPKLPSPYYDNAAA